MSHQELSRLEVMQRLVCGEMRQETAAEFLNISIRQVQRLLYAYRNQGPSGLVSKKRGQPSNRRISGSVRDEIISIIATQYGDFGPTLACEKLSEVHHIHVSAETVRKLMMDAEIWIPRSQRLKRAYQPRNRRGCYGELIQIDGSIHPWFEDRAPKCTLLVYIDDATSSLMTLYFVPSESLYTYALATEKYINAYGKPVAFYSDKLGVFHMNKKGYASDKIMTQFGRGLYELNIDLICANTPQAKGRVERANKTLQDRLVKELRLRNISTIEEANEFMPEFIASYNKRFAKPPLSEHDAHRPLQSHESLRNALCFKQQRTMTKNLTVQHDRIMYLFEDTAENRALRRKHIELHAYPDGSLAFFHESRQLPFRQLYDRVEQEIQGDVVPNKRLDEMVEKIKTTQQMRELKPMIRSKNAPNKHHLGIVHPLSKEFQADAR